MPTLNCVTVPCHIVPQSSAVSLTSVQARLGPWAILTFQLNAFAWVWTGMNEARARPFLAGLC